MKAIKTTYNGVTYRSRTEARWARFLELIGAGAQYEVEGFDLDGEWYIPDFFLSRSKCWLEVKPFAADAREERLARKLSKASAMPVVVVEGNPNDAVFKVTVGGNDMVRVSCVEEHEGSAAYLCSDKWRPDQGFGIWLSPGKNPAASYGLPHPQLREAGALQFDRDGSPMQSNYGGWRERERRRLIQNGYQFGRRVIR